GGDRACPRMMLGVCRLAFADPWRREDHTAAYAAARERYTELRAGCQGSRDAGHDLEIDTSGGQRIDFLLRTSEDHGIAAFEPHHSLVPHSGFAQRTI